MEIRRNDGRRASVRAEGRRASRRALGGRRAGARERLRLWEAWYVYAYVFSLLKASPRGGKATHIIFAERLSGLAYFLHTFISMVPWPGNDQKNEKNFL